MAHDLVFEGGTVVTPTGRSRAHVYVDHGRVVAVSDERRRARERVDAHGLLVMPGMVDAHVHLMDPGDPTREDFPSGSSAAAAAGVTTVLEHTHAAPVVAAGDLEEKAAYLATRSVVDFGLGAHALPDRLQDVPGVWAAGAAFVKAFTCTTHGIPGFTGDSLRALLATAASADATCLLHCEDEAMTAAAEQRLRKAGRVDPGVVVEWRSPEAELTALRRTIETAAACETRLVVAHVSNVGGLAAIADARARGVSVCAESCPQYLTLLEREILDEGAFRKFTPPARARSAADLDAMWRALDDGRIDYMASDHAPATVEQKRDGSIWDVHFGLPGIDTTMAILLDGAHAGRISYERLVEVYAERPARVYGLSARKGRLAPGADADVVLVDPAARREIRSEDIVSRARWSPFEGRSVTGAVVRTYLRGRLVAEDRRPVAQPGTGAFLRGRGASAR